MIKYKYKLKYMDEFNIVVMDFDEEKSLEYANMISDPLGSDIPWHSRFNRGGFKERYTRSNQIWRI